MSCTRIRWFAVLAILAVACTNDAPGAEIDTTDPGAAGGSTAGTGGARSTGAGGAKTDAGSGGRRATGGSTGVGGAASTGGSPAQAGDAGPGEPVGLQALTAIDRLPFLRLGDRSLHASSFDRTTNVTSTGRAHRGSSAFVVKIKPSNQGVLLRRLLDQTTGNQRARVLVDGSAAGEWLTAGSNPMHAWREDDFAVPATLTAGKSELAVEIQLESSDGDWTEFQYAALSVIPWRDPIRVQSETN
jgi:hypothetical protein